MSRRRQVIGVLVVSVLLVFACYGPVRGAEQYPSRGVDVVLGMGPGSGVDIFFRTIRETLSNELKAPVTVVNRPGGNAAVGVSSVVNSKADGYTLLGVEMPSLLITQAVMMKMPYDVFKDLEPICHLVFVPNLLVVRSDAKFATMQEMIAYAKKNPGKLVAGISGQTQTNRFDLELLKSVTGANIDHLPLVAGGELITSLLGGHINFTITNIATLKPHIKSGKLKALAVLTEERVPEFPQLPTTKEAGIPEVNINSSYCLLGPKGLQPEVTARLARAVSDTFKTPQVAANMAQLSFLPAFLGTAQLRERMEKDFARYQEIAKKAGIEKMK